MDKYEIIIFWSEEDAAYVADVPELPGCMAHGNSHEEAPANAKSAQEHGGEIPAPKGRRLLFA